MCSLSRKSKAIKQESEKFVQNVGTVGKTIEKAIEKIEKLFNYHGGLNIQVIDKKLLGDNPDIQELERKVWDNYKKMYGMNDDLPRWQTVFTTDDNIIFIRYQDKVINMRKVN